MKFTITFDRKRYECTKRRYLFSPGRKEVMGRLFSWQACPGCQLALQAEQNSRAQTAHWTSWGSAGESASFSWHTAWQVEEGHHVRHGSSSTSDGRLASVMDSSSFKGLVNQNDKEIDFVSQIYIDVLSSITN